MVLLVGGGGLAQIWYGCGLPLQVSPEVCDLAPEKLISNINAGSSI